MRCTRQAFNLASQFLLEHPTESTSQNMLRGGSSERLNERDTGNVGVAEGFA